MSLSKNALNVLKEQYQEEHNLVQQILDNLNNPEDQETQDEDIQSQLVCLEAITTGMTLLSTEDINQLTDTQTQQVLGAYQYSQAVLEVDLTPTTGLESVSTEGVGQAVKDIWKAMVEAVQRIWQTIKAFFSGTAGDIQRIKLHTKQIRHRAQNARNRSMKNTTTHLGREINALTTYLRQPRHSKDILDGLENYSRQLGVFTGDYGKRVKTVGDRLQHELSSFNVDQPEQGLEKLNAIVRDFDLLTAVKGSISVTEIQDGRWGGSQVYQLSNLMSRRAVFLIYPRSRGDSETVLSEAETLRNRRAILAMSSPEGIDTVESGELPTISATMVVTLCDQVLEICEQVSAYQPTAEMLKTVQDNIQKTTRSIGTTLEKREGIDSKTRSHLRAAINYNVAFARWATQPHAGLCSNAITVCRATLNACGKSLQNFQ